MQSMPKRIVSTPWIIAGCCFVGTIVAVLVCPLLSCPSSSSARDQTETQSNALKPAPGSYRRTSDDKNAFLLGVTIKFKTSEAKEKFQTMFAPLAEYVAQYELGTISYELCISDKDPLEVYIMERYKSKVDYLEIHRKTPLFLEFRQNLQSMSDTYVLTGSSYIESNIGFVGGSGKYIPLSGSSHLRSLLAPSSDLPLAFESHIYLSQSPVTMRSAATGWLIRRFLAPKASIVFCSEESDAAAEARRLSSTAGSVILFDAPGAKFPFGGQAAKSSTGPCSFEVIVQSNPNLASNGALLDLSRMLCASNDAVTPGTHPSRAGVEMIVDGLIRNAHEDSNAAFVSILSVLDAYYESYNSRAALQKFY